LGEIYISIEQARRQAKEYGASLQDEVLRLVTHGTLHLLGYDHELSMKDEKLMFRLQDTCFEELGIYNIFK
jgi:probable rRNA maturation factor